MKKILFPFILICIIVITSSCGTRNMKNNDSPELPIIESMELEKTKDGDFLGYPQGISTYIIENENIDSFLEKYENALEEEGWSIVERREPFAIDVEKNGYNATIIVYVSEDKLKVDIKRINNED